MRHEDIVAALAHDHPQYRDCPTGFRSRKHNRPAHTYSTPIPGRYEPRRTVDHLDPPGTPDVDFPGCVIQMLSIGVKIARAAAGRVLDVLFGEPDRTRYESRTGTR